MRYCVDFEANPYDWISRAGSFDGMADSSFACSRVWVIIHADEFAQLQKTTDANPLIPALSTLFAAVMAAAAVVWGLKRVYRLLITGGGKDE